MKRQIHAVRGHDEIAVAGHDIKLGRGGIREIEFFVQTQQLVFGGRRPALARPAHPRHAGELARRRLDHRSGARRARRTPTASCAPSSIACRWWRTSRRSACRGRDGARSASRISAAIPTLKRLREGARPRRRRSCSAIMRCCSRKGPELASDIGNLVFTGTTDDPETLATLQRLGFHEPERAAETVRGWHFGRRPADHDAARARGADRVRPGAACARSAARADPDAALAALDRAFGRMPAAVELLTILQSHDRLRLLFADLLGTAPRLADTVAQSPHVLDALIDPGLRRSARRRGGDRGAGAPAHRHSRPTTKTFSTAPATPRDRCASSPARGSSPASCRRRRRARPMRRSRDGHRARLASMQCDADFEAEHGMRARRARSPSSGSAASARASSPQAPISTSSSSTISTRATARAPARASSTSVVYYTRLTQRLVAALTVPTRRGRLYEVDLRLRPQGGKGPVASQFRGFVAYQTSEAELWEHMALTRARVLAGDEAFGRASRKPSRPSSPRRASRRPFSSRWRRCAN